MRYIAYALVEPLHINLWGNFHVIIPIRANMTCTHLFIFL